MSAEQHDTFSPQNLAVLGGLLFIGLILGEVVFPRNSGDAADPPLSVGTTAEVALRIQPVIRLDDILANTSANTSADDILASASDTVDSAGRSPQQLYAGACLACHVAGIAGAPKVGDQAAWESRLANGIDALVTSVINGKGAMPAKGGSTYSAEEIRATVEYMLAESGL